MTAERLLGFDCRIATVRDWLDARRARYLLRRDVVLPMSADTTVWPSVYDDETLSRPTWIGPLASFWEDLAELRRSLRENAVAAPHHLIAVTVHDPAAHELVEWSALPPTSPAERDPAWPLLGYDVCDTAPLSGIANCGYDDDDAPLRAAWSGRMNDRHLLATLEDAYELKLLTDARVTEHAPFFVYGLWSVA